MGLIPSVTNMPSAKFVFPPNFGTIQANTNFTVQLAIQGMETGFFVNAEQNYFAAPQQLNAQGQIQGHSHIVIEELSSFNQTTPTNPQKFTFFKGLNDAAQNGILSAVVAGGLPVGVYKVSSINTAANHQPVLVPIAQHGSLDDVVYVSIAFFSTCPSIITETSLASSLLQQTVMLLLVLLVLPVLPVHRQVPLLYRHPVQIIRRLVRRQPQPIHRASPLQQQAQQKRGRPLEGKRQIAVLALRAPARTIRRAEETEEMGTETELHKEVNSLLE